MAALMRTLVLVMPSVFVHAGDAIVASAAAGPDVLLCAGTS